MVERWEELALFLYWRIFPLGNLVLCSYVDLPYALSCFSGKLVLVGESW